MMQWNLTEHFTASQAVGMLGFIPSFLTEQDSRRMAEQLNDAYAHGGGWSPFGGFKAYKLTDGNWDAVRIQYPGDPAYKPVAWAQLRDETIVVFPDAWVMIVASDGTHEIARMD